MSFPASTLKNFGISAAAVVVADDAARFALTAAQVSLGSLVKVTSTGLYYFVINPTSLGNEGGYAALQSVNPMTTEGDLILGGEAGVPTRLGAGDATFVLTSNGPGVAPSWEEPGGGGGSVPNVDGEARLLIGADDVTSVDWGNFRLADFNGVTRVDWNSGVLSDSDGINVFLWQFRLFRNPFSQTVASFGGDGFKLERAVEFDRTITPIGTTGAQTIHRAAGTVNIAAGQSSVVVTNDQVTADSLVFAVIRTNDTTALIKSVVPAAGGFTIRLNANATAATSVGWFVSN